MYETFLVFVLGERHLKLYLNHMLTLSKIPVFGILKTV